MKSGLCLLAAGLCLPAATEIPPRVPDKTPDRFTPSPTTAVSVSGHAGDRVRLNIEKRLLTADLDALLEPYRNPPVKSATLPELAPKYLDAVAESWSYTNDARLKTLMDETVTRLMAGQQADGYLGAAAAGRRWQDADVWTQKFLIEALLNYYRYTGTASALDAAARAAGLLVKTFGESAGQRGLGSDWHRGIASGAIIEAMTPLYRYTGDLRYLSFARYVIRAWDEPEGPRIVDTLLRTGSVYRIPSRRTAEILSVLNGLIDLYRATGDESFRRPVDLAWTDIVSRRLYITGATGWGKQFRADHVLRADERDTQNGPGEGSATAAWLRLNWQLFRLTGDARYADQLERTIYNALLGAQHPTDGRLAFLTPLIGRKRYDQVNQGKPGLNSASSGIERAISLLPRMAWGRRNDAVAVNFYFAGKAEVPLIPGVKPFSVALHVETRFPSDGAVTLRVAPSLPARFPLELRVPSWCGRFTATLAGRSYNGRPGEYLRIERQWTDAATVEIRMDMTPRVVDGGPSYPNHVAIVRGPQVLALDDALTPVSDLWLAGIALTADRTVILKPQPGPTQAWLLEGYTGNERLPHRPAKLVLAPFAEAGQSGSEYRVWLSATPQ
jgi:hypothetical protein